jgi:hypothetical protein
MPFPQTRPYHGIAHTTQTNLHIDATRVVRSQIAPGVSETTHGTVQQLSRLRIRPPCAAQVHFQVVQTGDTTVKVHGGMWTRSVGGTEYNVFLVGDSTGLYAFLTANITFSASGFGVLTLDDPLHPTKITAAYSATAPSGDEKLTSREIFYVTVTGGKITNIEPCYRGGDIVDFILKPDGYSMGYHDGTGGLAYLLQQDGWAGRSNAEPADSDLFEYAGNSDDHQHYYSWSALKAACASAVHITKAMLDDAVAIILAWLKLNLRHDGLCDYSGDQHDGAHAGGGARYVEVTGGASRNNMSGTLGDGAGVASISPSLRQFLSTTGAALADWATAGVLRILLGTYLHVEDTTEADYTSGALLVEGGASIQKKLVIGSSSDIDVPKPSIYTAGGVHITKRLQIDDATPGGTLTGCLVMNGGFYFGQKATGAANGCVIDILPGSGYVIESAGGDIGVGSGQGFCVNGVKYAPTQFQVMDLTTGTKMTLEALARVV